MTVANGSTAGRRAARALALEPGDPPSPAARLAGRVLAATVRSGWALLPDGPGGLLWLQRIAALPPARPCPRGVRFARAAFAHCTGEWVRAGAPDERTALLYLHGGAYVFGGPKLYRPLTWRLAAATGRPVLALDYRLAPLHTPADALADALEAYRELLAAGRTDIVVAGDSAGGHLTLALLLAVEEAGLPRPAAAVTISPWADLTCSAESHTLNARTDSVLPAARLRRLGEGFCAGRAETDPLFAPVRGDFAGLPPLLVISTRNEILRDDSRLVAERARAAGVEVVHQEWDGLVHVFPLFADFIPEGKAAVGHIAAFLRRHAPR